MNTRTLTGLYDRLTPSERIPLIVAAIDRNDEPEANRLSWSAPTFAFRAPDFCGLSDSLLLLSLFHMAEKLDLALAFSAQIGLKFKYELSSEFEDRVMTERLRRCAT